MWGPSRPGPRHVGYSLVKPDAALELLPALGVCGRSEKIRDAIVAEVAGVDDCAEVTAAQVAAITTLDLTRQGIAELKANDLTGLTGLTWLSLHRNQLSSLPPDIFSDLSALTRLSLHRNQLSSLPAGLFAGLSGLIRLNLSLNTTDPLPIPVSLELVEEGQFRAVAPTGAPFALILPISVAGGATGGDASTVTIPAGAVESEIVSVTRTPGTTTAVTVTIGTLPALPERHLGYALNKPDTGLQVLPQSAETAGGTGNTTPRISIAVVKTPVAESAENIAFSVTLDRTTTGTVTVDYATADGTALAGADYTEATGTLTFEGGETQKTINVPLLDDDVDEGQETFTVTLSHAVGAQIANAMATGTITNSGSLPKAWLARFSRSVAGQVTDAIRERLEGGPEEESYVSLAGHRVPVGAALRDIADGEKPGLSQGTSWSSAGSWQWKNVRHALDAGLSAGPTGRRTLTSSDLILGSAFQLSLAEDGEQARGTLPRWTAWGRASSSRINGDEDGLALDGNVTTITLGLDIALEEWLAGVALAHGTGDGSFRNYPADSTDARQKGEGTVDSTITGVHPYLRLQVSERLMVWGILGYGTGDVTLEQHADRPIPIRLTAGTKMQMAAAGARSMLAPEPEGGGLQFALRTNVLVTRITSEAASSDDGNLAATEADTARLRLVLEGSRRFLIDGGKTLTPSLEVGLRQDGGDAETGIGAEVGGGVRYVGPGLSIEGRGRSLIRHEETSYKEWGISGSVRIDPGPSGAGLSLTLAPAWGPVSSGVDRLWSEDDARDLAPGGEVDPESRFEAELAYGFPVLGGRAVATPHVGWTRSGARRTLRIGQRLRRGPSEWRLESTFGEAERAFRAGYGYRLGAFLDLGVEASRREAANDNTAPAHEVGLNLKMRW